MREAWIYATSLETAGDTARELSKLGFTARRVGGGDALRPSLEDGGSDRRPAIIVVVGCESEPAPVGVCARLREDEELADVPVLVALEPTHLAAGVGVSEGHELIVQPFSIAELQTRIARALRAHDGTDAELIQVGGLELNLATYQVTIDGQPADFTYMEYELLKFLMTNPNRAFSRETLLSRVWGYDYYGGARTVDVHIRRVRAKLGHEHAGRIKTVRSVGYRFEG